MSGDVPLIAVVGPTASGKTALAVHLAEQCQGEIVSADSVQIYRHFDLGSGKPSPDELRRARHHLVDALDPLEPMDAALFAARAEACLADIRARGGTPIVCGGTYLWVRALVRGLAPTPPGDVHLRAEHRRRAEAEGRPALHAELARVDPVSAGRLAPNDFVRVSRALEVFALTGVPLSTWHAQHGFREYRHRAVLVSVGHDKATLEARIAERAGRMLRAGWIDEVRALLDRGYAGARAMRSVGYRQIAEALAARGGAEAPLTHDEVFEAVDRATRIFARRQRTWLRDEPVRWISPDRVDSIRLEDLLAPIDPSE
jgi:tRNA dimethylallyltransferase